MPRPAKGIRLWFRPEERSPEGKLIRNGQWFIRDGSKAIPTGCLSTRSSLGKPTQIIQPHWFGADASKATCLWLHMLPKLLPTKPVAPRRVNGKPRWGNQTDSGQNKLPPSEDRARQRAETYPGVADAMALWWKIELMEASHG